MTTSGAPWAFHRPRRDHGRLAPESRIVYVDHDALWRPEPSPFDVPDVSAHGGVTRKL